jgi:hypothetical protein
MAAVPLLGGDRTPSIHPVLMRLRGVVNEFRECFVNLIARTKLSNNAFSLVKYGSESIQIRVGSTKVSAGNRDPCPEYRNFREYRGVSGQTARPPTSRGLGGVDLRSSAGGLDAAKGALKTLALP